MATTLAILHGLVAVGLLGAITHQTLAVWAPSGVPPRNFFTRFRAVPSAAFANAIIVLYLISALLGSVVYLYFKVHIQPTCNATVIGRHWASLISKKTFWPSALACCLHIGFAGGGPWRERGWARAALTAVLAFIVWWSFLVGHIMNDIMGFGS